MSQSPCRHCKFWKFLFGAGSWMPKMVCAKDMLDAPNCKGFEQKENDPELWEEE